MQLKLIMTPLGQFKPAEWDGTNESGITPVGDRVLILTDESAEETAGGIVITDEMRERHSQAAETGVLVAMGDDAWLWNSDRSRKYEGAKPEVGQRVIFDRHAGQYHTGNDGRRYRLMDDKCVGGLFQVAQAKARVAIVKNPPLIVDPRKSGLPRSVA
jgi:co-chaperonin GroES (HSP10)